MSFTTTSTTTSLLSPHSNPSFKPPQLHSSKPLLPFPSNPSFKPLKKPIIITKTQVSPSSTTKQPTNPSSKYDQETIFFDGGAHYGDLLANLILGFTLFWLPLTLAAVSRAFFLRYRFTNLRVTVISGFTGDERSDFGYNVIKDVQVVPRFIGEWGDIVITLKDGTKVDLRSVPKFREIAKYCLSMADKPVVLKQSGPKAF